MQDIIVVGSDTTYAPYLLESLASDPLAVSLDMTNRIRRFADGLHKQTNYVMAQRHVAANASSLNLILVLDHHNVESAVTDFIAAVRASAKPDIPILSCSALTLKEQWDILSKNEAIRPSGVYAFEKLFDYTAERAHDMALILDKYTAGVGDLAFVIGNKRSRVPMYDRMEKTFTFQDVIQRSKSLARLDQRVMMDVPGTMPVLFDVTEDSAILPLPTLDLLSSATYAHATVFANFNSKIIDYSTSQEAR